MAVSTYCSFDFLINLLNENFIDFYDPDTLRKAQLIQFLLNSSVTLDIDKEKINEQISNQNLNPNILSLIRSGRLKHDSKVFLNLRTDDVMYFKKTKKQNAIYLLSNVSSDRLFELQSKSGYYFIGKNSDYNHLFEDIKTDFLSNQEFDKELFQQMLTPHHSMIIADPYVFKEKSINSIKRLLKQIIPHGLVSPYHMSFIGSSDRRNFNLRVSEINKSIDDIKNVAEKLSTSIIIEHYIVNEESFHDRYIITNNVEISLGSGLSSIDKHNRVSQDILLHADKPYRTVISNTKEKELVTNSIERRLKRYKEWISKSYETPSTNPLFNL